LLRWLLARGARLELRDWKERTALYWASWEGRAETVRELLQRGAVVDATANGGWTPFFNASKSNHLEAHSREGHLEIARELLARGASLSIAANSGATALSIATASDHAVVAALLRAAFVPPRRTRA
jgi:ankyrin repeat protein